MHKLMLCLALLFWVALPICLLLLPVDHFDEGPSHCPSMLFLGKPCFACGLTRAVQHLIHGDWTGARQFNPAVGFLFPALALGYVWLLFKLIVACRKSIRV